MYCRVPKYGFTQQPKLYFRDGTDCQDLYQTEEHAFYKCVDGKCLVCISKYTNGTNVHWFPKLDERQFYEKQVSHSGGFFRNKIKSEILSIEKFYSNPFNILFVDCIFVCLFAFYLFHAIQSIHASIYIPTYLFMHLFKNCTNCM